MRKLVFTLLIIFSSFSLGLSQNTIETELQQILNQKSDELISVNIILKSQMNFNDLRISTDKIIDKNIKMPNTQIQKQ